MARMSTGTQPAAWTTSAIYVGAVGVRDLADGPGVVEKPFDVRNQGQRDKLGVVVDRTLVLLRSDLPVLLLDDPQFEPGVLQAAIDIGFLRDSAARR